MNCHLTGAETLKEEIEICLHCDYPECYEDKAERLPYKSKSKEIRDSRIREMFCQGKSRKDLAVEFNLAVRTIQDIVKRCTQ